ncbi:MAG: hypothetical protein LC102_13200 [Ignavibacteriales bacterium]|jgi:hypothetical protein|nr:MAG: hypothetical protein F9K26_00920 [Ignavibacteriaceae bacterium]MBW7871972.1 hypothetical protein [Ignavibacteria bacterium]MCZ2144370.1 hypothetical protein [Ignavibacteriales bacterium]MBV6446131.1 hypothetical protein [Ignavibacteriaceae bacterium]MBZ0197413.1 hypothetical protein [Ignavibacteriaceae bacterium]
MKRLFSVSVLTLAALLFFSGCDKKEDNPVDPPPPAKDALVGTWVSEGSDVAPGLVSVSKTVRVVATFNENKTYKVVSTDSSNTSVTFEGTWSYTDNAGTDIKSITLNQSTPAALTSSGIFEISASGNLTYEIIQTNPAIQGFTAPTAAEGFGSTKYNGIKLGVTWIQKYVKHNPETEPLVGKWLSEGANIAPGLATVSKTKRIDATFNSNGTYKVVSTDSSDAQVTFEGTFTTRTVAGTSIREITLNQTAPSALTSSGIYRVNTSGMWYEVIQTNPALQGFTAPNSTEGFGSTKYNGVKLGATWIQKYVKN